MIPIKHYKSVVYLSGLLLLINFNSGQSKVNNQKVQNQQYILTVVFDNVRYSRNLKTAWGFGCVIRTGSDTVLFDTGSDGKILLANMAKLGLDPQSVKSVVISHEHWDHLDGLTEFLRVNPNVTVYIPNSFSQQIESNITTAGAKVVRIKSRREIVRSIFSLGELNEGIAEQSLAIDTPKGMVIMTGCAHPGIVNIIRHAKSLFPARPVYLAMGGFHLKSYDEQKIKQIVASFEQLGVQKVAPSHCTGEQAIEIFKQVFGNNFIPSGVGNVIKIQ